MDYFKSAEELFVNSKKYERGSAYDFFVSDLNRYGEIIMNDMEYITQKLIELGWEDYSGEFYSKDGRFKADILYNIDGHYEVRVALVGIFDRWANSGVGVKFTEKEDVISFFEKDEYMSVAFSEVTDIIKDSISDPETKEFLYKLIDMSAKWFNEV